MDSDKIGTDKVLGIDKISRNDAIPGYVYFFRPAFPPRYLLFEGLECSYS